MRIAVTSSGPDLDSPVDPRLGRAMYFVVVDTDTLNYESHPNPAAQAASGAGIMAAQFLASLGVSHVITGNAGPNASQALGAAGIQILTGISGTVRQAVDAFKRGELAPAATQAPPPGTGGPPPGSWGGGFGRGGGGGFGRGGKGGGFGRGGGGGFGRGGGGGFGRGGGPFF